MKTKKEIATNWLTRYTTRSLSEFAPHILLTNFTSYLQAFAKKIGEPILGESASMPNCGNAEMTMIHIGMGSPNAATIMDLLSAVEPRAVVFLGKCGGLKSQLTLGDYVLPIAAIRGEGTSDDYMPREVPSLPSFNVLKACSNALLEAGISYAPGTIYTTNRRLWEHDEHFKDYLRTTHADAIDMETATLFTVGYANRIPTGALLMVSDMPMTPEGVKSDESDSYVTAHFAEQHFQLGIRTVESLRQSPEEMKSIVFDW